MRIRMFEILMFAVCVLMGCVPPNVRSTRAQGLPVGPQRERAPSGATNYSMVGNSRAGGTAVKRPQDKPQENAPGRGARGKDERGESGKLIQPSGEPDSGGSRPEEVSDEVAFGTARRSLTSSLSRARKRIQSQQAEIQQLQETLHSSQSELKDVKEERDRLKAKVSEQGKRVESLKQAVQDWKENVLGYRDEMRQAEKAEMQTLKQIIMLLRQSARSPDESREEETAGKEEE